jgi:outer membrane protein OmpA-like peptidoglycan-associated protein
MKKILIANFFFLFSIIVVFSDFSNAQFNDYTAKLGFQMNGIVTDTEFDKDIRPDNADFKFSFIGRAFLRFEFFTDMVETEVGGGFGRLSGVDRDNLNWWTYIIPIDLRFIFSPFDMDVWSPYIFTGAGGMYYTIDKLPSIPSPNSFSENGWTGVIPFGGGFEIGVSESFILDFSGGYTYTFSDDLNGYNNEADNDGFYNINIGFTFVNGSGSSDKDMDGLTKSEELELGTKPDEPDTDGDGLKDGDEVRIYLTDALNPDSDSDKLGDKEEIFIYNTNPMKDDSDGDELSDGSEVTLYNTNPLKTDTDLDTVSDSKEIIEYKTNPLKADTDNDNLDDAAEINRYKTNPLKADTDYDGLADGEEVNRYRTDPLNTDTDGGTVDDFTEVSRGTDPLNADDDVIKIDVPIILEGITFETGKSEITPESEVVLQGALKTLETYTDIIVQISGHTDDVGSETSNQKLSQSRADAVRNWLIGNNIDPNRIIAVGYGEDAPIVPNDSNENRRKNRRIEFKRIK